MATSIARSSPAMWLPSATFSGNAEFRSATFLPKRDLLPRFFRSATFSGDAVFQARPSPAMPPSWSATFSGGAVLRSATFSGDANFWSATFSRNATFQSATFSGYAYSSRARPSPAMPTFRSATFSGECRLADFRKEVCKGHASFERAVFERAVRFQNRAFQSSVNFKNVTFKTEPPQLHDASLHADTDWGAGDPWPPIPSDPEDSAAAWAALQAAEADHVGAEEFRG